MRPWMLLLLLSFPTPAGAQARPVLHQRLVGQLGPMGAEHALALGVRADLGDPDEPLFAGAHAEAGVVDYTSPIYSNNGLYLEVSPLAFLVLRGTLTATAVWPIGMPGAEAWRIRFILSNDATLPPVDTCFWSDSLS